MPTPLLAVLQVATTPGVSGNAGQGGGTLSLWVCPPGNPSTLLWESLSPGLYWKPLKPESCASGFAFSVPTFYSLSLFSFLPLFPPSSIFISN